MADFDFGFFDVGEGRLHYASAGDPSRPLILCLHGFPEYWAAWSGVMTELADAFFLVAPDQRGFNLSFKPQGEEAYRTRRTVADLAALVDHLSPRRPFILAGHDWGASVAYAYAFSHADRLSHLVIANGAHPVCFQRAILEDQGQRSASQYFHTLRAPGAAARMAENDFARTMKMLAGFSRTDWLTPEIAAGYRAAWAQPGAMEAMLHWYKSSPIVVPKPGDVVDDAPLLAVAPERVTVAMPHLVLWGEADEALRPACLEGLDDFAPDLTVERVPGAGHWILHEKPAAVAAAIRTFLGQG
ncbi:alpha/beta hydrolase [Aquibium sp. ELW1220]|uniref:alpha/beta fold hydrolase n=1 Tax=Aquibium sp. ELW1220 TaxID=2976766 RepID=UPI0025B26004|nr:alpha/beta hydrolase [Aquibium sp. ELW1220]MDN2581356.1 alpha/beta hydrolase [Aquibium sp. ELW1220]